MFSLLGEEESHIRLRALISVFYSTFYSRHWGSRFDVRTVGEWVDDFHILAAAAFLKVFSFKFLSLLFLKDDMIDDHRHQIHKNVFIKKKRIHKNGH